MSNCPDFVVMIPIGDKKWLGVSKEKDLWIRCDHTDQSILLARSEWHAISVAAYIDRLSIHLPNAEGADCEQS